MTEVLADIASLELITYLEVITDQAYNCMLAWNVGGLHYSTGSCLPHSSLGSCFSNRGASIDAAGTFMKGCMYKIESLSLTSSFI
jgi:hypothetical protein